jgi:phosphatidylglycerophosphate synthase
MSAPPTTTTTAVIDQSARRPLKSRQSRWAATSAAWLARRNVSPNTISLGSVAFACVTGGAYVGVVYAQHTPWLVSVLLVVACLGMQGRLVCNLLDGMVAVEGGKGSPVGELYNDMPDRIADGIIFATAGYAAGTVYGPALGWLAVAFAILTAYVRVLGRSLGAGVYFTGPMAKQHRMAALTAANVLGAILTPWAWHRWPLLVALGLIVVGSAFTCVRRLNLIAGELRRKAGR